MRSMMSYQVIQRPGHFSIGGSGEAVVRRGQVWRDGSGILGRLAGENRVPPGCPSVKLFSRNLNHRLAPWFAESP